MGLASKNERRLSSLRHTAEKSSLQGTLGTAVGFRPNGADAERGVVAGQGRVGPTQTFGTDWRRAPDSRARPSRRQGERGFPSREEGVP